ncbi:hypothetical protein GSI_15413 [Ganoderma sinense ZZ0214-1]|uniref:DUF6534 domain-containing protein n=1 Tax=Ganoderma sinense ZZ0214-1 TaxID=1077348 RepID=A0A2G8RMJ4_9APHY|nr:hypothetical protein GSI_15413 [Ganoderma sinense ZZ0214-1]
MASSTVVLADAPPTVQLGSTYGVFLVSIIVAAALYGFTVLQSFFYYQEFPKDRLILKVTEVWSTQVELLVTFTLYSKSNFDDSLDYNSFFIMRIYHLRPHLWYIPALFGIVAVGSYASVVAVFIKVEIFNQWSDTAPSGIVAPIIANWTMGNVVDIGITVVLCWYLWSEKTGVPHRTDVMLNHIIVFLVNRGAVAAGVQVLTLLTKLVMPQNFIWIAFHNMLSKVYTNSMLATLNARVGFRKIIMDSRYDQTVPPIEFSVQPSRPVSKMPPLPDKHHFSWNAYTAYESQSTSTGTGSDGYDRRSGLVSFHRDQRSLSSDQSSVTTDLTDYPRLHSLRDDHPPNLKHSNVV